MDHDGTLLLGGLLCSGLAAAEHAEETALGRSGRGDRWLPAEVFEVALEHVAVVGTTVVARDALDDLPLHVLFARCWCHIARIVGMALAIAEREDVQLPVQVEDHGPRDEADEQVVRQAVAVLVVEGA